MYSPGFQKGFIAAHVCRAFVSQIAVRNIMYTFKGCILHIILKWNNSNKPNLAVGKAFLSDAGRLPGAVSTNFIRKAM